MNLIQFPEQNVIIAKDQPQYLPLPAHRRKDDPEGCLTCCWALSWRERLIVLLTGRVWHQVLTFGKSLQPQLLLASKPDLS